MQIVVEEALVVGVTLNFFILKLSAKILGRKGRLFLLSALAGEVVSLFYPLFVISLPLKILLAVLTGVFMLCVSFEFLSVKKFCILSTVFLLATFVFGGACEALESLIGSFPLFIIALVGLVVYFVCVLIYRLVFRQERIKQFVYKVQIKDGGFEIEEEGYLDSGNVLYDKISGQPIILVNFDVFHKIYSSISLSKFLCKQYKLSSIKNGHYIKINSIGKGTSMLVFSVDEVVVGGTKSHKNVMLGLSFSGFEKSFGRKILLHCDMV